MTKALVPVDQREVEFYDDLLTAVRADDGHVYVVIRHMCEALEINTQAQTRRIRRQEILADGYKGVAKIATPGGIQRAAVLRVDLVPLWLTGISTKSVAKEVRPKLERFQREAAKALWEAFQEGRLTTDPAFDELLQADTPATQAYKMIAVLQQLARNQVLLEAQVDEHGRTLEDYGRRLETIEADMHQEDRYISEGQATQISQAIRAIALTMSNRSGKNEYGRCWGEFYRKFGVSKYRYLPAGKFQEAMKWLTDWHGDLTDDVPF